MSYLYRTGNSRNNIAFTNTANSSIRYLRRLGSGRTNINWYTIPQGSTYNILNRTGTGRNNIAWANLKIAGSTDPITQSNISGNFVLRDPYGSVKTDMFDIYRGNKGYYITGFNLGQTYGTTITGLKASIDSATVITDDYIAFPFCKSIPSNFGSLLNRFYLYENDNNYMIISVSGFDDRYVESSGIYRMEWSSFEISTTKSNSTYGNSFTGLFRHWYFDKPSLTLVCYHW